MSYYNELNELYMEKVAARSYGRNPDGTKRTAEQLVIQLRGADYHPTLNGASKLQRDGNTKVQFVGTYINPKKSALPIEKPKYFLTGNGKYNFSITSPKRIELGAELLKSKQYSEKFIRQHANHENRLSAPVTLRINGKTYKSDTMKDNIDTFSNNTKWDGKRGNYVNTHKKRSQEEYAKALREHGKKDRAEIKDMIKRFQAQDGKKSSTVPRAVLSAGLLAAGMVETKNLYDKIKAKREKEQKEKKELASAKA